MRMPGRTGAVHRPRRPIIGSPDAQPAATPDTAVGDRTPFLRLPRHRRPLPVSGGRPAQPRLGVGGTTRLDRPGRPGAARHGRARGPASSGSAARFPRRGCWGRSPPSPLLDRRQRDPERRRRRHGGGQAAPTSPCSRSEPPRSSTRAQRFADARLVPRRLLHRGRRLGRGRVRRRRRQAPGLVHGRARPGRARDDGARARARVPLRPRPAAADGRARRRSSSARSGSSSARRWRACSASISAPWRWSRSRSCAATCAAAPSSSRSLICAAVTAGTLRRCAAPTSAFSSPGSGRRRRRRASTPRAGASG